jgi:soluble lytic murein transglycosylase-like protein
MSYVVKYFFVSLFFVSSLMAQAKPAVRTTPMEPLPEEPAAAEAAPPPAVAAPAAKPPRVLPVRKKLAAPPPGSFEESLRRQAESVGRQVQTLQEHYPSFWRQTIPAGAVAPEGHAEPFQAATANCPPVPKLDLQTMVEREAKRNSLSETLLQAVIEQESGNLPCAVSPKGAMGLMQLMPATAQTLQVKDPFDPAENIAAGSKFLKSLLDRYQGDMAKALAAYNAGPGRVDQTGEIPDIPETQNYVGRILSRVAEREKAIQ